MKTFLKWLSGVLVVFFLLVLTLAMILDSVLDTEPDIPDHAYLQIRLQGPLPEYIPPDPLKSVLGRTPFDMTKFRDVLEKAAVDDRINGVIIKIGFLQVGLGEAQELVELIHRFRDNGKKIYAFMGPGISFTRDYYVASACDSVFMTPQANLLLTGLYSEITYYKDFFNKIGVEAEFVQIGNYKNAPDPYTRSTMSPEQREEIEQLLDAWYADIRETIIRHRNISNDSMDKLINEQTGLIGIEAFKAGLVDTICYYDDVVEYLVDEKGYPEKLSAREYARVPASDLDIRDESKVAVVHCIGTISGGSHSEDYLMGRLAGAASFIDDMEKAVKTSSVKAIILRIDSPGGSAAASEIMWEAVRKAAEKKPVIASISGMGASGGYYIALPADTIIVQKSSIIGSIGIFAGKFSIKKLYNKLGLNAESIKRGKNAALFSVLQPWSDSEKAVIFHLLQRYYSDFKLKVSEGRGIPFEQIEALAGGRIYTGHDAVKHRLTDMSGSFYNAIDAAKELAGIDSDESVRLVYYPARKSLLSEILSGIQIKSYTSSPLIDSYRKLEELIIKWQGRPLVLMPFKLDWTP